MNVFFMVLARDEQHVRKKIQELEGLHIPYIIVCGEPYDHPNIVYRKPIGKFDAINFGMNFIPDNTDILVMNDVDSTIRNLHAALDHFRDEETVLVVTKSTVTHGPQHIFLTLQNMIQKKILMLADGDLMLIRYGVMKEVLPLQPCKAEDTYILFKVAEKHRRGIVFCDECYIETGKTNSEREEEAYKRRTVAGIYQALSYTVPPPSIRLFYTLLPFVTPILLVLGRKGVYWTRGVLLGLVDFLRGDRRGSWTPIT